MSERAQRGDLLRHQVQVLSHTDARSQVSREQLATVTRQLHQFNTSEVLRSQFEGLSAQGRRCVLVPEIFHPNPSVPRPVDGEGGLFYRNQDGTVRSGIGWDFRYDGALDVTYRGIRIVAHPGFILVVGADTAVIDPRVMQEYRIISGQTSPQLNPFAAAVEYSIEHPGTFKVPQLTLSDAANSLVRVDFGD